MTHILYGDGIHDDTAAIQEMIDTSSEVVLPMPKAFYLISKSLELHSDLRLVLPRFAEIRLAPGTCCPMLKNKTVIHRQDRIQRPECFGYVNVYSPDAPCRNIEVVGGIWNSDNAAQKSRDGSTRQEMEELESHEFSDRLMHIWRFGFFFYNVRHLRISSLTIKNPVCFGVLMDTVSYFTVDNVCFDYNGLNGSMDGVHICGNCHYGQITNLQGTCYDDLLAFNADEGSNGDITNIDVRGIYSEDCHSAVRILNVTNRVENIHITEVHGTYVTHCITLGKYYPYEYTGSIDGIVIDNITASKAAYTDKFPKYGLNPYALISIDRVKAGNIRISNMHRNEYNRPLPSIEITEGSEVESLILDNITYTNHTGQESAPMIVNNGLVERLDVRNLRDND